MLQSFQKFFCGRFICRSVLYTIGGSEMLQKNENFSVPYATFLLY